jgi:ABC-2 type transport system ATP-binding protein
MKNVIDIQGLVKTYGGLTGVDHLNLQVAPGMIFGLIGHNGAGKSSTIECMLGLRRRDAGTIRIMGMNPDQDRKAIFSRVGVQFQDSRFPNKLKVQEACLVQASLYAKAKNWQGMLEDFGIAHKAKAEINQLSGGERQKLSLILALIGKPDLVVLDELSTGLDPSARQDVWTILRTLNQQGLSILMSSHYMDEVDALCHEVAIMRQGKIAVQGSPEQLKAASNSANLDQVFLDVLRNNSNTQEQAS